MSAAELRGLCSPHTFGVPVGAPPFFYPDCRKCQEKRAAGKVRGDEGPLPELGWRKRVKRSDPKEFAARAARDRAARLAARGTMG